MLGKKPKFLYIYIFLFISSCMLIYFYLLTQQTEKKKNFFLFYIKVDVSEFYHNFLASTTSFVVMILCKKTEY